MASPKPARTPSHCAADSLKPWRKTVSTGGWWTATAAWSLGTAGFHDHDRRLAGGGKPVTVHHVDADDRRAPGAVEDHRPRLHDTLRDRSEIVQLELQGRRPVIGRNQTEHGR